MESGKLEKLRNFLSNFDQFFRSRRSMRNNNTMTKRKFEIVNGFSMISRFTFRSNSCQQAGISVLGIIHFT